MKELFEQWRKTLKERVYSDIVHSFIQYSYELDNILQDPPADNEIFKKYNYNSSKIKQNYLIRFLRKHFKEAGTGSTRNVYVSPSNELVKIANKSSGYKHNKKEIQIFNRPDMEIFPRIMAYDEKDYMWFVVEKVEVLDTGDVFGEYKKLFPKLIQLSQSVLEKENIIFNDLSKWEKKWFPTYVVLELLAFKYYRKAGLSDASLEKVINDIFRNKLRSTMVKKYAVDAILKYYKDPDLNFAKLLRATIDADIDPYDMHAGNLGHDGKWNIRLIDAG